MVRLTQEKHLRPPLDVGVQRWSAYLTSQAVDNMCNAMEAAKSGVVERAFGKGKEDAFQRRMMKEHETVKGKGNGVVFMYSFFLCMDNLIIHELVPKLLMKHKHFFICQEP